MAVCDDYGDQCLLAWFARHCECALHVCTQHLDLHGWHYNQALVAHHASFWLHKWPWWLWSCVSEKFVLEIVMDERFWLPNFARPRQQHADRAIHSLVSGGVYRWILCLWSNAVMFSSKSCECAVWMLRGQRGFEESTPTASGWLSNPKEIMMMRDGSTSSISSSDVMGFDCNQSYC